MKGTAKYEEIFSEGSPFQSLQKFDVEKEFRIICGFPPFQEISASNESKEGIKRMFCSYV